jgi:hypothetical protein
MDNRQSQMVQALGQFFVFISGLALIAVAYLVTKEPNTLVGIIFIGGMLVNMSKKPATALKQGLVVLITNLFVGMVVVATGKPEMLVGMLGSWFLMVRI